MKFVTFSTSTTSTRTGLLLEDGIQPLPFASLMDLIEAGEVDSNAFATFRIQAGFRLMGPGFTLRFLVLRLCVMGMHSSRTSKPPTQIAAVRCRKNGISFPYSISPTLITSTGRKM